MRKATLARAVGAETATARTSSLSFRVRSALVAVTTLALAILPMMVEPAAAAPTNYAYTASAFGTSVTVGSVVESGPSAPVALGCTTENNVNLSNTTAGVDLGPLGRTGPVSTTARSYNSPVRATATAYTKTLSLLGGLVRASAIRAVSSTTRDGSGFDLSAEGTTLTNLRVLGLPVSASAAPNTRINLPGVGHIIINEQIRRSNGLTVNGLHIHVTATDTHIIVSQAVSGLSGPVVGVLAGTAYGTYAAIGDVVSSGPSFKISVPCLGTDGAVRTNTGVGVDIGTILETETITNTARGTLTATTATSQTTSTVEELDLLDDLVEATAIKADAEVNRNGSDYTVSGTGSSFGTLSVAGHDAIDADVAPNTRITISGVGTLYLNRQIRSEKSITVIMVQLILTEPGWRLPPRHRHQSRHRQRQDQLSLIGRTSTTAIPDSGPQARPAVRLSDEHHNVHRPPIVDVVRFDTRWAEGPASHH